MNVNVLWLREVLCRRKKEKGENVGESVLEIGGVVGAVERKSVVCGGK